MCFEIPEYVHFLLFTFGFLFLGFGCVAICMKLMPNEGAIYSGKK